MTNLRNYVNLTVTRVPPLDLDGVKLSQLGQGAGMHASRRFHAPIALRARGCVQPAEYPSATAEEAVLAAFHIMNQFDIPYGTVRDESGKETVTESTQWTTVSDMKNMRFYFKTYGNQNIHMVDLAKAFAAAKGQVRIVKMGTEQPIEDLSTDFMSGKQAAGAGQ